MAAKRGLPVFAEVVRRLRSGDADDLIVYTVYRSARNPKDWAGLGGLIARGSPVYLAGEA
jgi:hypothetical protein